MRKLMFAALLTGLFCCCSSSNLPKFEVIENTVSDIPMKSQILLRLELTDSTYTKAQVIELCELMARTKCAQKMNANPVPTHVWIYIYKSKADCLKDGGSWIAMYGKAGSDQPGDYTYR